MRLSRAEEWAITAKLGDRGWDLNQIPAKNVLPELYPLAFRGLKETASRGFFRRLRGFIEQCYKIKDSCTPAQRQLLVYLATTGDLKHGTRSDATKSRPECFTCERPCCIISMNGDEAVLVCPFFTNHRCRAYTVRPELCRTYVCPEITKLPPGHALLRVKSEFFGDSSWGKFCTDECYAFAIPDEKVEAARNIRLAYGLDHPTREGTAWKLLRQLGALEVTRDLHGIRYEPI